MGKQEDDRAELERRLEQARRLARVAGDALTRNRLLALARDLEGQLQASRGPPGPMMLFE